MASSYITDYNTDSTDVTNIIFVYNSQDILCPTKKCKPLMTHQIFEEENIYGYHGLKIDIYFTAHSAYCYFDIHYDDIIRGGKKFGLEPDNVIALLTPWFPSNVITDFDTFKACADKDEPDYIYGDCIDCFRTKNEQGKMTGFRVINCDLTIPGAKEFHQRFQSLIIMFIDAANFIDLDDPYWRVLYLYEECRIGGKTKYCPVGFCTMYLFSGTTTVARISQFFIVPYLQKLGLGYRLLDATYNFLKDTVNNLEDITVESPNSIFTRMRDNLDASHLIKEIHFKKEEVLKGFSDRMLGIARLKYRLTNSQARRVYEILRCFWSQNNPMEYERFEVDLKEHRKAQYWLQMKQLRSRGYMSQNNNDALDTPLECSITLQHEFDKFVNSIQMTLSFLERHYGEFKEA